MDLGVLKILGSFLKDLSPPGVDSVAETYLGIKFSRDGGRENGHNRKKE